MIRNSYFISYLGFINFKTPCSLIHSFFFHASSVHRWDIWVRGARLRELKNYVCLGIGVNSEKVNN